MKMKKNNRINKSKVFFSIFIILMLILVMSSFVYKQKYYGKDSNWSERREIEKDLDININIGFEGYIVKKVKYDTSFSQGFDFIYVDGKESYYSCTYYEVNKEMDDQKLIAKIYDIKNSDQYKKIEVDDYDVYHISSIMGNKTEGVYYDTNTILYRNNNAVYSIEFSGEFNEDNIEDLIKDVEDTSF